MKEKNGRLPPPAMLILPSGSSPSLIASRLTAAGLAGLTATSAAQPHAGATSRFAAAAIFRPALTLIGSAALRLTLFGTASLGRALLLEASAALGALRRASWLGSFRLKIAAPLGSWLWLWLAAAKSRLLILSALFFAEIPALWLATLRRLALLLSRSATLSPPRRAAWLSTFRLEIATPFSALLLFAAAK